MKKSDPWYTYILHCRDGSYYTGATNDVEGRIEAHNAGQGAKYTRGRMPVKLVYSETFKTRQQALRREWEIKSMTRAQKESLVRLTSRS